MKSLHKRFVAVIFVLLLAPISPVLAAVLPAGVVIVELQTGGAGAGAATQEFVELYNASPTDIDITGWKLQYRAASKLAADTWPATSATTIGCATGSPADCTVVLGGHARLVLATSAMGLSTAISLNGGFAEAGGQVRLLQPTGAVEDFVGYGTALDFEGAAAPKPAGGESLKRKVGGDGMYIDTSNNAADFTLACGSPTPNDVRQPVAGTPDGCPLFELPTPQPETPPETPTEPTPDPQPEPEQPPVEQPPTQETPPAEPTPNEPPVEPALPSEPEVPAEPPVPQEPPLPPSPPADLPAPEAPSTLPPTPAVTYLPLEITEVFPDPASPQTDAADEFVELYNPNDQAVDLQGYAIKTIAATQHVVPLPSVTVPAGGYVVIKSADSTLSLVNSGASVQLIDPLGAVRSESPNYQAALAGQSWIKSGDTWVWTTTLTPGLANVATQPAPPAEEPPAPPSEDPINTQTPPEPEPSDPAPEEPAPGQGSGTVVYSPILITELLPDPAAPGQDSTDEFIEIFNPNGEPVNLKDYQLQSGTGYRYHYILPDVLLGAGQYLVITAEESGLSLSNSGSPVRILDPNLVTVDEVASYGKAEEGQSWSKNSAGVWLWTTTLTPAAVNAFTVPIKAVKAAAAKTAAKKAPAAAKPKVASATKTKTAEATNDNNPFVEPAAPAPNYWLLAGVGSMAAGYGVYEYRQGLLGGIRKLWQLARGKNAEH